MRHNELRHTVDEGGLTLSFLQNKDTGENRAVLPPEVASVRTLTLGLDEGSICTAGVAAAAFQQKTTVWARFDKIHRIIRDLKLAENGICDNVFAKAKLWSAYLYGLNNRPFGSGANYTLKERLLDLFQVTESVASEVFQRYVARIAKDFEQPCDTWDDQERIFNAIMELKSFKQKLGQPKISNWFAWNKMAHEQMGEFHATKCVFAAVYTSDADPDEDGPFDSPTSDPKAQLQAILKGGGGVVLAFRLMKSELQRHVKIMYIAEQACWCWYTDEIENTKAPKDACAYSLRLAGNGWQNEPHLWETIAPLQSPEKPRFMEIPVGESKWATRLLVLTWHIVMRRSWSLAKHSAPPESLAGLLAPAAETKARTAGELGIAHRQFLLLERRANALDDAALLRKDIIFLDSAAVRLVFEFYARDKYAPTSASGQKAIMAHIWCLPDNKIVEDIHQPLRLNARANVNRKLSFRNIQDTILGSGVLEKRGICHSCELSKSVWVRKYKVTKVKTTSDTHRSHKHKLPPAWSRLMKPGKTWHTLNEETLQRASAAWVWMRAYMDGRGRSLPEATRIGDGRMSKLAPPCAILRHNVDGGQTFASLGNRVWAALGLPLQDFDVDGELHYAFVRTPVVWFHIHAPGQWEVVPFVAVRCEGRGVVMKATGPPQPLVKYVLTTKNTHMLNADDLRRLVDHFALQPASVGEPLTTEVMINLLALFYGLRRS